MKFPKCCRGGALSLKAATAFALSLCLIVAGFSFPSATFAASATDKWDGTANFDWYLNHTQGEPYVLYSAEDLAGLAQIVNGTTSGPAIESPGIPGYGFEGDIVLLETDVDLGAVYDPADIDNGAGGWSGQEWKEIGANAQSVTHPEKEDYTSTPLAQSFKGTFDGQGHVIGNMFVNAQYAAGDNNNEDNYKGLFGKVGIGATVRNVGVVSGYVRGDRGVGGIAGGNYGHIENSFNRATVVGNSQRGVGGIAGYHYNDGGEFSIINCYNAGSVTNIGSATSSSHGKAGGLAGTSEGLIKNSYNIGTVYSEVQNTVRAGGITGTNQSANTSLVDNSYSLDTAHELAVGSGGGKMIIGAGESVTVVQADLLKSAGFMKSTDFLSLINGDGAFVADAKNINDGYPILAWQARYDVTPLVSAVDATGPDPAGNVTITVNPAGDIRAGETVTVTLSYAENWFFDGFAIRAGAGDINYNTITDGISYTFAMPSANAAITVTALYKAPPVVDENAGTATAPVEVETTLTESDETGKVTATVTVDQTKVAEAVNDAVNAAAAASAGAAETTVIPAVEIKATTPADAQTQPTEVRVELPSAALQAVAAAVEAVTEAAGENSDIVENSTVLRITSDVGVIELDMKALETVAAESAQAVSVTFVVDEINKDSVLNERQKTAVGDAPVYDISVLAGDEAITDLGGGHIKISLPYTLKTGERSDGVKIWYIDANGNINANIPVSYDSATKTVTFTTTHLSLYAIVYQEPAKEPVNTGGGGGLSVVQNEEEQNEDEQQPSVTSTDNAWSNPFGDVKAADWFYADVEYAVTTGLFNGTSANAFGPNAPMTRGMIVTVLGRLYDADISAYTAGGFDDVAAGQYYTAYVEWAKENGIVGGVGGNLFAPNDNVTRQDFAVILLRYADFAKKQFPTTRQFVTFADDAEIADYARNAVQTLYNGGIINGVGNNAINPKGSATRAEVAAMLHRFIDATD
jgi:hypothetical protein